jgi:hypothetical protein
VSAAASSQQVQQQLSTAKAGLEAHLKSEKAVDLAKPPALETRQPMRPAWRRLWLSVDPFGNPLLSNRIAPTQKEPRKFIEFLFSYFDIIEGEVDYEALNASVAEWLLPTGIIPHVTGELLIMPMPDGSTVHVGTQHRRYRELQQRYRDRLATVKRQERRRQQEVERLRQIQRKARA